MEILKKMLKKREDNQANILIKRLDRLWVRKQKEKESQIKKVRSENIKCKYLYDVKILMKSNFFYLLLVIRKLVKKRENIENTLKRRDIIEDYANYASEAYAPLTRHGNFPDRNAENYQVKNKYLDTYQGLLELEASLPPHVLQLTIKAPKRQTTTKDGYLKRKYREEKRLEDIHAV